MKQHLVEIKGSTLFDEYLQSMGGAQHGAG